MKKIKILHVQQNIGSGGVERRRLSLAKHLDKNIFEQKFVCTQAIGNIPDEIRKEGWDVIPIGILKSQFQWSQHIKVQKIIQEYQPDIIHGAVFEGVAMAAINGWLKNVPKIIIEETSDPKNRSWRGNLLMKIFSKIAHAIIGVSPAVTEEYLLSKLNLPVNKIHLVNNGVALPRKVTSEEIVAAQVKWGIEKKDVIIGSIGRMVDDSNKRFSDLIKAFAKFSLGKTDVKLLLVGDGPEKERYIKLATDLKMSDKVIFAGYQADVTLFYKMMNLFSLVSRNESFGLVLAEAMLNKLPVVATKVGGMKYIVDDQQTGYLVQPFQVDEIAEKLNYFYQNPEICLEMGERGFERAMKLYTEEIYVKNVESLYIKLGKKKK